LLSAGQALTCEDVGRLLTSAGEFHVNVQRNDIGPLSLKRLESLPVSAMSQSRIPIFSQIQISSSKPRSNGDGQPHQAVHCSEKIEVLCSFQDSPA